MPRAAAPSVKVNNTRTGGFHLQYQPQLRPDHIAALSHLQGAGQQPMMKLAREAVDANVAMMQRKQEEATRAGRTLADWVAYTTAMDEASAASKRDADLNNANAPV